MLISVFWLDPRLGNATNTNVTVDGSEMKSEPNPFAVNFTTFTVMEAEFLKHIWKPDLYFYNNREAEVKSVLNTDMKPSVDVRLN